jgi:hypothetical protein
MDPPLQACTCDEVPELKKKIFKNDIFHTPSLLIFLVCPYTIFILYTHPLNHIVQGHETPEKYQGVGVSGVKV